MADLVQMKIPKTYDEQILNLQEKHGLIIADCAKAKEILKNHRALEVDSKLMPFKDIITLIDEL